jgi:sugar transferase (PEP-CTERM system associated)
MIKLFSQYIPYRLALLFVAENGIILATIYAMAQARLNGLEDSLTPTDPLLIKAAFITLICQLSFYFHDLYDLRKVKEIKELLLSLIQALGASSIAVAIIYLVLPTFFLGQGVFFRVVLILLVVFSLWRIVFLFVNRRMLFKRPALILGTGEWAREVAKEILDRPELGFRIAGFVSEDRSLVGQSILNPRVLGHMDDLKDIVGVNGIDRLIVALPQARGSLPFAHLLDLKLRGLQIEDAADIYEMITGKIAVQNLRPSWLIFSEGFKTSRLTLAYKRLFSIIFSFLGILVSWPIMVLVALAIKLDSPGPVFYAQERIGKNGRRFKLLKFRSMAANAEAKTGAVWAQANDSRITRVGKIIRKTRIDELPQFINVIRGDLNFVGPRPERPKFVEELSEIIPYYNQRHTVTPGITGWAQICYSYGASVEDAMEKLQYDLYYIKNMSLLLDLSIMFQTLKTVLLRRGAH